MLEILAQWPGATLLRRSSIVYLLVNAGHILSIGLILGPMLALDLRLVGLFSRFPLAVLGPFLSRTAMVGIVLAVITGLLLFTVRPVLYAQNPAFLAKLGLVALALINALLIHANPAWRLALQNGEVPTVIRLQAFGSMLAWTSAVIAGRWIGFL